MTRGLLIIRKKSSLNIKRRKVVAQTELNLGFMVNNMFSGQREIPIKKIGSTEDYCKIRLSVQYITPKHTFYTPPTVNTDELLPKYLMLTVHEANLFVWSTIGLCYFLELEVVG